MTIAFNNIPGNIRVPLFYAEFNSGGTPYQSLARLLLVGQKLAAGTASANIPVQMRDGQEDQFFGADSMLAEMYRVARDNAPFQEIWCLPLADATAGVAATGKITVAGAPLSAASTLTVYIAGIRIRIPVASSDTNANICTKLITAINGAPGVPVTAAVNADEDDQCDLTARHKGTLGNEIAIDLALFGDEGTTGSTLLTVNAMAGGSGDPEIDAGFANLSVDEFDWIGSAYADVTNLGYADDLLNDVSGRWSPIQQLYGHYITAKQSNLAGLTTLGNGRNDQHVSVMGYYKSPSPPWAWAAAVAAKAAKHLQAAPELSRPLQTLDLRGIQAPRIEDRFNITERNILYYDGIAGYHVERDGTVSIDRLTTTYQLNEWGSPDATWLDVNTLAQSIFGIRYLKAKITNAHGRQALADANPTGLQGVTTADDVRDTIVHGYAELVGLGVFENLDLFENDLIVERNATDANRVDAYLPLDHVNQLRIIAVNATSFLQRRSAADQLLAA